LLKTLILGVLVLLIFGIIIYQYFRMDFNEEYGRNVNTTFYMTVMSTIKDGFIYGLINKLNRKKFVEESIDQNVNYEYWAMWWLQFIFFFFITSIFYNMIQGVIVNKIKELREERTAIFDKINKTCFMCVIIKYINL